MTWYYWKTRQIRKGRRETQTGRNFYEDIYSANRENSEEMADIDGAPKGSKDFSQSQ